MKFNPELHNRRSIRLSEYDYTKGGAYFVTICTANRECLFGQVLEGEMHVNEFGKVVLECWEWLSKPYSYATLDARILMPNHLHGIIVINDDDSQKGGSRTAPTIFPKRKPLGRLVGAFKTVSTKRINELRQTPGFALWQRNYYEHIIRNENSLNKIRDYILGNPSRWVLDQENPDVAANRMNRNKEALLEKTFFEELRKSKL